LFEIVEILLNIPKSLFSQREDLKGIIKTIFENSKEHNSIELKITDNLSKDSKLIISLIDERLGESDKKFHQKYIDKDIKFLFYYFQDVELDIDEIDDKVFERIEFKDSIARNKKICNNFKDLNDIKNSLEVNLKEAIFDIINKTNYSKINPSVTNQSKGDRFYEIDNNLRRIDNFLRRGKRVSLINGLGGVGKTTLAIEYAKSAIENEIYDYLIWFDVENGIDSEIKNFAIKFLLSDMEDGKQDFTYYEFKFNQFLEQYPNSLIILDNYEDSAEFEGKLKKFLDKFPSTDIIITSRQNISKKFNISSMELNIFQNIDDALEMFILNSTRDYSFDEKQTIKQIINYLGNLPLALEITANFLSDNNMEVEEYLKALKSEGLKLFDKISDYTPKNHLEGLIATLKINSKISKNANSLKLLKSFALFAPEPINKDVIEKYLIKELNISEFDKVVSLKDLEKFSYIKVTDDYYSMHRLLQESIINDFFQNKDEQIEIIKKISISIFDWIKNSLNESKYGTYFNEIREHIEYILAKWDITDENEIKIYLYTFFHIKEVIKLDIKNIDERRRAIVYNQYGIDLRLNSKYDEALEYLYKALDINLKTLGENHLDTAGNYNNIGSVYYYKKNYDKALEYYNKSLKIDLKTLGENHPRTAADYNNIGSVYHKNYDKALEHYKKALEINLKTLGDNHPNTAITYNNVGLAYKEKNHKKALEYFYKALEIDLKTLGENHPDTATTYNNIGLLYDNKKIIMKL